MSMPDIASQQSDGRGLSAGEHELVQAVGQGRFVDLRVGDVELDDPVQGGNWAAERTVRAELLVGLLTGERTPDGGRLRAVKLRGARITGALDLEAAELVCPVLLADCYFEEPVNLGQATAPAIRLPGCYLTGLTAEQLRTSGNLDLSNGLTVEGETSLRGARIGGQLDLSRARLINPGRQALDAEGLTVEQSMFCREGVITGEVHLLGAHIGGTLSFDGTELINPGGCALNADVITVDKGVFFQHAFVGQGEVRLVGARIRGILALTGARLTNPGGRALNAYLLAVEHGMYGEDGFTVEGELRLSGAQIGGVLGLDRARLINPDASALEAEGLTVARDMSCRSLTAEGEVRMLGARIGGRLLFDAAHLANPGGRALYAVRQSVDDDLLFRHGFTAEGEIQLSDSRVGGHLEFIGARLTNPGAVALTGDTLIVEQNIVCGNGSVVDGEVSLAGARSGNMVSFAGATLNNPDGHALRGTRLTVDSDMYLQGFTATGAVQLSGARLGGLIDMSESALSNPDGHALDLEDVQATALLLRPRRSPDGAINLSNARIGLFDDDPKTWPTTLHLQGFSYNTLANDHVDVRGRLRWLARHPGGYVPETYDQLGAAYRRAGQEEAARRVAIAKQRHRRTVLNPVGKLADWLLYLTVGYGYRTWLAAFWLAGLLALGSVVFASAHPHHMTRVDVHGPEFNALAYSLDVLLPVGDLGQKTAWRPDGAAMYYSWAFMAAGWVLTTAVVAGLTGLLKRE
ncbi:hypothetical protein [Streptomyces sp. NPDC054783]